MAEVDAEAAAFLLDFRDQVRVGEFVKPSRQDFWELPNLILTPHTSGGTDIPTDELAELFYENLARFIAGRELINVIDWARGY